MVMDDDIDSLPERETKDFMFRQLKKIRLFDPPKDVVSERSNLLAISNKFGLVFAGGSPGLRIFHTKDLLVPFQAGENRNHIAAGPASISIPLRLPTHHVALSSDNLTLSVCIAAGEHGTFIYFYDVRTLLNETKPQKRPFASYKLPKNGNNFVTDLKWNPAIPIMVAVCLDDGSISVLQVTDTISVYAALPASMGVTSVCWSPKGKQLAVGKQNGTIVQFLPNLQEKKVIPCPSFYNSENPVKVLDVLWVSTYVFSVVYAAADGSEIPPQLVMVYLPKKEDKRAERFQTFPDVFYGSCTERQQHFFLNYVDGWEILLGASAVSSEVCVVARPPEDETQIGFEVWLPEDTNRAELPVNENSDDTLPMGLVVDYTSQLNIVISDEKFLPPAPVLLILSTDGVLCPFHVINLNPRVKSLTIPLERLSLEGERQIKTTGTGPTPAAAPTPQATSAQPPPQPPLSATLMNLAPGTAPGGFSFGTKPAPTNSSKQVNPPAFSFQSMQGAGVFGIGGLGPGSSAPPAQAQVTAPSFLPAPSTVKVNLKDKFNAAEGQSSAPVANVSASSFSFNSPNKPLALVDPPSGALTFQPQVPAAPSRPSAANVTQVKPSTPAASTQKTAKVNPPAAKQTPSQPQENLPSENQFKQSNESDPFLSGIKEEISQFQKELDDLKARTTKNRVLVGTETEMRRLRIETDDLQDFLLKIKETTESLNSEVCILKMNLLEQFSVVQEAKEQDRQKQDPRYRNLLYKKPLDPKSEAQMQEIRRLHQYVKFAVQDVNDVLDMEWDQHLMNKKNQKSLVVPESERLFNTLANNQEIINQQKQQLNQLVHRLQQLRLYNQESEWSLPHGTQSLESELENLQNDMSKISIEMKPKPQAKRPPKLSAMKQRQLREFLANRKTPVIRALAPASLHRSSFLAPSFFEDSDDVSSTSSLSETAGNEERQPFPEETRDTPPPEVTPIRTQHAAVVRTSSVLPGYGSPSSTFGKQFGPSPITSTPAIPAQSIRVIPQGADSTMLATKTVKHGAPAIPPQQAAAAAALRRQINSQVPASLTETTLQTVPQVVNVKDLKGNGPGPTISTALGPSVPHSAAQVIQQVLVSVGSVPAKQAPSGNAVKMHPAPPPPSSSLISPTQGPPAPSKPAAPVIPNSETPSASASTPPTTVSQSRQTFSFPGSSTGFSFGSIAAAPVSSSSIGSNTAAPPRDPGQATPFTFGNKPVFGSGSSGPFSFSSLKPAPQPSSTLLGDPAATAATVKLPVSSTASLMGSSTTMDKTETTAAKQGDGLFLQSSGGETLGSFSGLRVGQIEDTPKPDNSKATLSSQPTKLPSAPLFSSAGGLQASVPGEVSSTTSSSSGSLFSNLQLAGAGSPSPGLFSAAASKQTLPFPTQSSTASSSSGSLASAALSFQSLLAPASSIPLAATSDPANQTITVSNPDTVEALGVAPSSPSVSSSTTDDKQPLKSDKPAFPSQQQQSPLIGTTEGDQDQAPKQAATGSAIAATTTQFAPTAVSIGPSGEQAVVTKPDEAPAPAIPVTVNSALTTTVSSEVASPTAPVNTLIGGLSSQSPAAQSGASAIPPTGSSTSSAFGAPAVPSSTQAATSAFGQPTSSSSVPSPFGQQSINPASTSASTTPGFGTSAFGQASTTGGGFGTPSFGQAPAFWKPQSATSASNFSFASSSFGTQPAFGQPPTSTAAASSSGGLFGSTESSVSASNFSFLPQSNSGNSPTAGGGGLFGQSSTPAFGQSSGFGQAAPVFGNASSTTTTSSISFGFRPSTGFTTNTSGSVFGQSPNTATSVFGQQPSSSSGGLFGSGGGGAGSGGFFSGLGGKPSQDAANKNPFGSSPSGFGSSNSNSTTLFGNSGAKSFGFGNSAFSDQKATGTFSGGGSVASQGFGFTSPSKTGGFGAAPVFGSPPTFGGSPGFGGSPAFGTAPAFASPLGPTGGKVFGEGTAAANTGGFGFGAGTGNVTFANLASQNTPTFGSLSQQNTGFGEQQSGGFSGFGSSGSGAPAATSGGFGFGVSNQSTSAFGGGWRG